MNKERALQGIEALIQDGNNVLKTMRNSELGGTYVDSAMYNSWLAKAITFLKLFLENDNEIVKGLSGSDCCRFYQAQHCIPEGLNSQCHGNNCSCQ